MQTLPTFVYLIPVLTLFGLGNAPGLIVTIIFVIPTSVRLTHLGVTSVPTAIIEAGESFGATKRQLLWKVELPSALPTIMAGLTQSIMLSLSMVVFAALIGAGGLGTEINRALGSRKIDLGLEAGSGDRHPGDHSRPGHPHRRRRQEMSVAVEFKNVDIMFGDDTRAAVAMLDAGATPRRDPGKDRQRARLRRRQPDRQ